MHRLRKILIQNFRSCKTLNIELNRFTPMVGYNNAGKSTIVQAVKWLLSPSGEIGESDYYNNDTTQPISVMGEIIGISGGILEKLEDKHRTKIEPYVSEDGRLFIKRVQTDPGSNKKDRPLYILTPDKDIHSEESWNKNPTGIDAAISAILPSPLHIEAMEDSAEDAAKFKAGSTLGKLLKEVLGTVEEQHGQEISKVLDSLRDVLCAEGSCRADELCAIDGSANDALKDLFPGIEIRTEIPAPTIQTLFKSGTIKVHDQQRGDSWHDFESMGHGAQRTIQMALIRCMAERAKAEDDPACTLLLIDEPELYLHPQAIEQVRFALKQLSNSGYQVIFSTHSPMLIDRNDVPNTLLIRRDGNGTIVLPTMTIAAAERIADNTAQAETLFTLSNSSQILFCEKALLVEGKTEARLLPYLYEKVIGRTLGMDKIALVPLGGSGGVKKASEIIEAMGLRYRAVVDLDFVFRHGAECGLLYDPDQNINTCMEYFAKRNQDGEIELDELGLPKKNQNGFTAADVYAQCAESTDCTSSIASLHEQAKDRNVWAWPNGDIEKLLGIEGKRESVWARFTNEVEQRGLEERVNDLDTLKAFTAWVKA